MEEYEQGRLEGKLESQPVSEEDSRDPSDSGIHMLSGYSSSDKRLRLPENTQDQIGHNYSGKNPDDPRYRDDIY